MTTLEAFGGLTGRPRLAALVLLLATQGRATAALQQPHPLDPLSRAELERGMASLREGGALGSNTYLAFLGLAEPSKAAVLGGQPVRREALAVTYDFDANRTTEIIVDLTSGRLASSRVVPGAQPLHMERDSKVAAEILRRDPAWRRLVERRGIGPDTIRIFGYPIGANSPPGVRDRLVIVRIEQVIAYLNLTKRQVYRLVDTGTPGGGQADSPFGSSALVAGREPSPLRTTLAGRPGYRRDGWAVEWDHWRFRIGLAPKEGLLLYQASFGPPNAHRSVLYKASLSELWVPYGDRGQGDFFLNAFDIGEVGIARYGQPEMSEADCPAHAEFIPVSYLDLKASLVDVARGFCLYERDGGTAWRHGTTGRRQRQLVLSSVFRIDNYDYGINWLFHQDGTLEAEVLLTGIMNARPEDHARHATSLVADTSYSTAVAPGIAAMHHQHFFSFRLDLDVAGAGGNSVVEMNAVAPPRGAANPWGNAIQLRQTVLGRELAARRKLDLNAHRFWRVVNGDTRNGLGQPVSYALWPGENGVPYALPTSKTLRRAGYTLNHLWVTPFDDREQHAAGEYVYQSEGDDGLPTWTARNRSIAATDLVLWYTLGITHIPRPEDWPVMPVHRAGFKLAPFGAFDANPALDLAPEVPLK